MMVHPEPRALFPGPRVLEPATRSEDGVGARALSKGRVGQAL